MKLAILLLWLAGCGGPQTYAGRRGVIDGADPALARLTVDVSARQQADGPVEVWVVLSEAKRSQNCFTVTDDYRVLVDDQPTTLVYPGGLSSTAQISGFTLPATCGAAQFKAAPSPGALTRITIEHAGKRAELTIAELTTPRTLRVSPARPLRPGEEVTLDWTPHGDRWSGAGSDAWVSIYEPAEFSAKAAIDVDEPRFRFTLPQVRPGPALLDLYLPHLEAHPAIQRCVGVDRCTGHVDHATDREARDHFGAGR